MVSNYTALLTILYICVLFSVGILYTFKTTSASKNDKHKCPATQPSLTEDGNDGNVPIDDDSVRAFSTVELATNPAAAISALKFLESPEISKESSEVSNVLHNSSTTEDSKDRFLKIDGQLHLSYTQIGTFLSNSNNTLIQGNVTTSLLQIFTTNIEKEIVDKFMNIYEDVGAFIKSPSLMWHNDELIISFGIRLKKGYVPNNGIIKHCWGYTCNYNYMKKFDRYLNPIGAGILTNINAPQGLSTDKNGPHDARLFRINDQVYSLFITGYLNGWISGIWDYQKRTHFIPEFQKQLIRNGRITFEKNWAPIVVNNTLYTIRHLDPMHVIKCNIYKSCEFIRNDTDAFEYKMIDHQVPLRGGTSFELYRYPYYIGIGHSTIHDGTNRHYSSHLMVQCVLQPEFRIVYVGDPIEINPTIYSYFEGEMIWKVVQGDFFFPTGLLIENEDSIVIGGHVNDRGSVLLRMEGIKGIMDKVMILDKENRKYHMKGSSFQVQKCVLERLNKLYPEWNQVHPKNLSSKILNASGITR